MRPHQWEPRARSTPLDWRPLALLLAPWLALGLMDILGL
jgi:hypothetical protein